MDGSGAAVSSDTTDQASHYETKMAVHFDRTKSASGPSSTGQVVTPETGCPQVGSRFQRAVEDKRHAKDQTDRVPYKRR